MKARIFLPVLLSVMAAVSCNVKVEEDVADENQLPEFITLSLPGTEDQTKVDFSTSTGKMVGTWSEGDAVCITPCLVYRSLSSIYRVTNPGSSTGIFAREGSGSQSAGEPNGVFYPGDKVNSQISYWDFSYEGQTQSKSDPLAHTKNFYCFMAEVPNNTVWSYGGSTSNIFLNATSFVQSSCMKMSLSGMTFNNPTKIMLTVNGGTFYLTNYHDGNYYAPEEGETFSWPVSANSVSLGLDGYGTESSIEAYLMMSDGDVDISAGGRITVTVVCSDGAYFADVNIPSALTLKGGNMHVLNVDSGWTKSGGDYTEYEWDGDVVTLQERGSGLDLVIMGDGFIAADFEGVNDGVYGDRMREAAEQFFVPQPLKSLKDQFNVYYVKVPSPERLNATNTGANGAENGDAVTKLSTKFTANSTHMSGDDDTVIKYARKAFSTNADSRASKMTVIVVANQCCRAGTCNLSFSYSTDYGLGHSIAYCALGNSTAERHELVHHEAAGHGFGKLGDEYTSTSYYTNVSSAQSQLDQYHGYGVYGNVDKYISGTTDATNVYWKGLFDTANNYESSSVEGLGVFEGAYAVYSGFCRPSDDSIMNTNHGIFNAAARRAIYYRYRHLRGELSDDQKLFGTQDELDAFLSYDSGILSDIVSTKSNASKVSVRPNCVEELPLPLGEPVLIPGEWVNGEFIPYEAR